MTNKYDKLNRTSINVSRSLRDLIQKLECVYTLEYHKKISSGDLLELIFYALSKSNDDDSMLRFFVNSLISLNKEGLR
jgi:ligand-binding sensor protein